MLMREDGTVEFRELDKDDLKILGNDKQIGKTVRNNGIVVSDNFKAKFDVGEVTKTYDELLNMSEEARRVELMSSRMSSRMEYMGATPGKTSKQGKEVIERMRLQGKIEERLDGTYFHGSDNQWYPLAEADMCHIDDAVTWWNNTGRKFGARTEEIRAFMLKSDNYVLDHFSINRSQGSKLGRTPDGKYLPPL